MPEEDETRGLVEALGRGMTERLAAQGWTAMDGRRPSHRSPTGRAFQRTLGDGFSAVVIFPSQAKEWRPLENGRIESSGLIVVGRIGVGYESAEALISACTGSKVSGVILNTPATSATVCVAAELEEAEAQLANFADDHAVAAAQHHADVDSLIDALREHLAFPFTGEADSWYASLGIEPGSGLGPLESIEAELLPALLATAGRDREARVVLTDYISRNVGGIERRAYRRFARQLTRWLDADGQLPPPSTPPRWRPPESFQWKPQSTPSFAEHFFDEDRKAKARSDRQARKEALDAVRAVGHDKSRGEIRALLQRELSERGLSTEPLLMERQVEMILADRESFGKVRFALRTLRALKDSQSSRDGILEQVSERPNEPDDAPDWLQPPDRAAYPVWSFGPKWTSVELDPVACEWLERIKDSDPGHLAGSRKLEVWLAWDNGRSATDPRLAVHIGAERVGMLHADVEEQFRPVMKAAAERDEDPWTRGRLSATSGLPPFLLEVELPASVAGTDSPGSSHSPLRPVKLSP